MREGSIDPLYIHTLPTSVPYKKRDSMPSTRSSLATTHPTHVGVPHAPTKAAKKVASSEKSKPKPAQALGPCTEERLPNENEIWYIIQSMIDRYGMVRHQVESFDTFITTLLPHIVEESSEMRVQQGNQTHVVTICNLSVTRPSFTDSDGVIRDLTPMTARLRSMSYSSAILVDVVHDIYSGDERKERRLFREVCLCHLPIMVGSQCCHTQHEQTSMECRLDQGGYFIVGGCEKALIAQEKMHHNAPYVFQVKQPSKYVLQCEIRSCHERKLRSTSSMYVYITNGKKGCTPEMVVTLPFVWMQLPVMALFRFLGVETLEGAIEMIVGVTNDNTTERRLLRSIISHDATADMTTESLYEYVGREGTREVTKEKRQRYIDHIINCECLPHQGLVHTPEVLRAKALYLGLMVRKLIRVYRGELKCDDRDHYATKRIDCAGVQFGLLFRQVFRAAQKVFNIQLYKASEANKMEYTNVGELVAGKKITQQFRYALATGNWGILSVKGNTSQTGVAQQLNRMTQTSTVAVLRKVSTPIARETKNPKPRQIHPTSWGVMCPMDTPEGIGCGLTKTLTMSVHVRIGSSSVPIFEQLDLASEKIEGLTSVMSTSATLRSSAIPILVNGTLYMFAVSSTVADELATHMRKLKRDFTIPFDATIARCDNILYIDTDSGCLLRPLLRVDMLYKLPALLRQSPTHEGLFDFLMLHGCIEYIDKQEEESIRVAVWSTKTPGKGRESWDAYTHCEIDPSFTLTGLCGSLIPFGDGNQSPRNTYQAAMQKQALGVPSLNYLMRMDAVSHAMVYPQRPIVATRFDTTIGASDAPAGVNAMIVIKCYTGRNQEDSLIINKASLDRGMFRSVKYQTHRDEERHSGGADAEKIENVNNVLNLAGKKDANYKPLDDSGIAAVGSRLKEGDVIVGKTVSTTELGEGARKAVKRDKSTILKHDGGIVDAVLKAKNRDGSNFVKMRMRSTRIPIEGDKFASRMGQKGVVGAALPHEDMPFTEDGQVPDIIVNPHAIPSRMTIGMLKETLLSILCAKTGNRGDGTMFRDSSIDFMCEELKRHGYNEHGRTKMRNGLTGEEFEGLVFFGPAYYQRLRHFSKDKDHARSRGPVQMLSRQPTEGRARDGGLRFGEMEKDCVVAHGAAEFLRDRLLDNSDPSSATICGTCGLLSQPNASGTHVRHRQSSCRNCQTTDNIKEMQCPHAFRLMMQELMAMNIGLRFDFDKDESHK